MDYREWKRNNENKGILSLQYNYTQDIYGKYKKDGYMYDVDMSRSHGILHITNELSIMFSMKNKELVFNGAWELGCGGDWSYKAEERKEFEHDHPGLLKTIEEKMNAKQYSIYKED